MAKSIEEIKRMIDHGTDGPLTPFVIISRGCEAIGRGEKADDVANAIHETLCEFNWIRDDSDAFIYTGS